MKVRASVKKICRNCKIIKRNGVVRVICSDSNISNDKVDSKERWVAVGSPPLKCLQFGIRLSILTGFSTDAYKL